jgi:hypothetical protein
MAIATAPYRHASAGRREINLDPPFCRRALLMDANYGGIDHLQVELEEVRLARLIAQLGLYMDPPKPVVAQRFTPRIRPETIVASEYGTPKSWEQALKSLERMASV